MQLPADKQIRFSVINEGYCPELMSWTACACMPYTSLPFDEVWGVELIYTRPV